MYRLKDIIDAYKHLVGWEESYTEEEAISEDLSKTESGLYFQDAHPLLTLRSMKAIMPEDWGKGYKTWDSGVTYLKDSKVRYDNKIFVALSTTIGDAPITGGEIDSHWSKVTPLSDFLENITIKGIKKVVQTFIETKVENVETKNIIDKRTLFDGAGRLNARIENSGKICGYEIVPLRSGGITMKLERVGLQFTGNTGEVTLYLFHSSQSEPVWTKTITYNATNGSYQWFDLTDVYLNYLSDNNSGGSWYFVYNQKDLPPFMEAINFARDWSREPCATCNHGDVALYREMTKYATISPFKVSAPEGFAENPRLWDIENNIYTNTTNYGINLLFSIGCDLTDFMISERGIFASALQKQVATDALRTLALNPEVNVNRVQSNATRLDILYETDGNGEGIKGLQGELAKAYKALSLTLKVLIESASPAIRVVLNLGQ